MILAPAVLFLENDAVILVIIRKTVIFLQEIIAHILGTPAGSSKIVPIESKRQRFDDRSSNDVCFNSCQQGPSELCIRRR